MVKPIPPEVIRIAQQAVNGTPEEQLNKLLGTLYVDIEKRAASALGTPLEPENVLAAKEAVRLQGGPIDDNALQSILSPQAEISGDTPMATPNNPRKEGGISR